MAPRILGIISDTHGLVRPQALTALAGVEQVVHAGDIGGPDVLRELGGVAPVVAVRGNNDIGEWADALPDRRRFRAGAIEVFVLHDLHDLDFDPAAAGIDVVIAGHSHKPKLEHRDGVLYLNPGAAGPRRFRLPVAVALLHIDGDRANAELIELDVLGSR